MGPSLLYKFLMGSAALALAIVIVLSLKMGAVAVSWPSLLHLLSEGQLASLSERPAFAILWSLRLPRCLMAVLVGAVLGLAGASLQGLLRNPLASPSLIGISSGAALCAAGAIVLQHKLLQVFAIDLGIWLVPFAAFAGSLVCSLWVFALAMNGHRMDTGLMLLAGVAINSLCGAGTGLLTFFADDAQLRNLTYWTLGSVAGSDWQQLGMVLLFSLPALIVLPMMGRTLNALLLGESEAQHLGIPLESRKRLMIVLISLAVGCAVAFSGIIGFVGLIVPHLLRLMLGSDQRRILPASCVLGALLLAASDLIARSIAGPLELPLGVVTAAIGSPYFLWLLRSYKRSIHL